MNVFEHVTLSAAYALPFTFVGLLIVIFTYVRRRGFSRKQVIVRIAVTWAVATLLVAVFGERALGGIPLMLAVLVTGYLVFFLTPSRNTGQS